MDQKTDSRQRRTPSARAATPAGRRHQEFEEPRGDGGAFAAAARTRDGATGLAVCLIALAAAQAPGQTNPGVGDPRFDADPAFERLQPAFAMAASPGVPGAVEVLARECEALLLRPLLRPGSARPAGASRPAWEVPAGIPRVHDVDIAGPAPAAAHPGRADSAAADGAWTDPFRPSSPVVWDIEAALRISTGFLHAPAGPGGFLADAFEPSAARPLRSESPVHALPLVREELLNSSHAVLALAASAR